MVFFRLVKKTLALDYRSLALYRALIGVILLVDSIYRMTDLTSFYTDIGLVPRNLFLNELTMPWSFSILLANGSTIFAAIFFIINCLFAVMIMLGYKTRWAMIGAYIFNVSIHNRNWLINNGGDDILRALLLISIFLPLNKFFSIDSALERKKEIPHEEEWFSTWGLTFFLQVFCIYFVSYLLKDHAIWRVDFTALFFASRLDIFATGFGTWIRQFTGLQKVMTIVTILLEWGAPLLLIGSAAFGRFWWMVRMFVVLSMIGLHLGIILTMWIGVFPYTCIVMWLIFLPGPFWDRLIGHFRKKGYGNLTIYFDGECRFCEKSARIIREFFLLPEAKVEIAQDHAAIYKLMQKNNSWVVEDQQGEKHFHENGFIAILKQSPFHRILLPIFSPLKSLMHPIYVWVAGHRPLMSHFSQFLNFTEHKKTFRSSIWFFEIAGGVLFLTVLMWNLTTIKRWNIQAPFFQTISRNLHIYQEWNMFAPFPKLDNIWVEVPAVLTDNSEIDLITGDRDIFKVKDKDFPGAVGNEHWRKFYLNLGDKVDNARYYGGFFCRLWNDRKLGFVKDVKLKKLEIIVYSQMNHLDGSKGEALRKLSWKHWCFDEDYKKESKDTK